MVTSKILLFYILSTSIINTSLSSILRQPRSSSAPLHIHTDEDRVPGLYIVGLKDNVDIDAVIDEFQITSQQDRPIRRKFKKVIRGFAASMSPDTLEKIRKSDYVDFVEEEMIFHTLSSVPWGIDRVDQRNLPLDGTASFQGNGGAGTHIYVVDTGIRATHSSFTGRVSSNGFDGIDSGRPIGYDCNGHGTHVSGTAAGVTYGIATSATLHQVRVFGCTGSTTTEIILESLDWVAQNAQFPAVCSNSWGGSFSTSIQEAMLRLYSLGIVVTAAAGNSNSNACKFSPASTPTVITVAASRQNDRRASFTNWGSCVDIFAPGQDVLSAGISSDSSTAVLSGTSMSCPHVTGVAAVIMVSFGTSTPDSIANILTLCSTRDKIKGPVRKTPNRLLYFGTECTSAMGVLQKNLSPPHCPAGWISFDSYCYMYVDSAATQTDASLYCLEHDNLGATLASINSAKENDFILDLSQGKRIWIGLNDMSKEGHFVWEDNSRFAFAHWASNQPEGERDGHDCVVFGSYLDQTGVWNDDDCYLRIPFVCKV